MNKTQSITLQGKSPLFAQQRKQRRKVKERNVENQSSPEAKTTKEKFHLKGKEGKKYFLKRMYRLMCNKKSKLKATIKSWKLRSP